MPFSGSLQYGNATRLQADDGSDWGHARWLFRRDKVGRAWRPPAPRVEQDEHARPFFDEFWRFGPDKGTSIDFGHGTRAAARVVEGVLTATGVLSCSASAQDPFGDHRQKKHGESGLRSRYLPYAERAIYQLI